MTSHFLEWLILGQIIALLASYTSRSETWIAHCASNFPEYVSSETEFPFHFPPLIPIIGVLFS